MREKITCEKGEHISNFLTCNCGNYSDMHLICEGTDWELDYKPELSTWGVFDYRILRCPLCDEITILRYIRVDGDIRDPDDMYYEWTREILYSPPKKRDAAIPDTIIDVLSQAERVVPTSPRASFILCRSVLEEICRHHKIADKKPDGKFKPLDKKLDELVEKERLPALLQDVMHKIRLLTNESTHGSHSALNKNISADEVETLISVVDWILNRLYVDKAREKEATESLESLKTKVQSSFEE